MSLFIRRSEVAGRAQPKSCSSACPRASIATVILCFCGCCCCVGPSSVFLSIRPLGYIELTLCGVLIPFSPAVLCLDRQARSSELVLTRPAAALDEADLLLSQKPEFMGCTITTSQRNKRQKFRTTSFRAKGVKEGKTKKQNTLAPKHLKESFRPKCNFQSVILWFLFRF